MFRLLAAALARAEALGCETMFLEVAADNAAALGLYRTAGFVQAGLRRGYYHRPGGDMDALVLRRDLNTASPEPYDRIDDAAPSGRRSGAVDRLEKLCMEKGMRMTEQRRVIARVLSGAEDHPDVEELHRRAHAVDPHISIATVYRTVRLFEESGILTRHDFRDGRSRYEEAQR